MRSLAFIAGLLLAISLVFAADTPSEEETGPARLLVEKKIFNKYLVERKDIIIHYHIYNVGKSAAIDVNINDATLSPEYFTLVSGVSDFTIPRVAPGATHNVTHTIVYQTKEGVWGRFNFTSGSVYYKPSEDAKTVQRGLTSEPGEGYIVSAKEFERRFSAHAMDWIVFIVMTLPCVGLPYLLWYRSKRKYERPLSNKINKSK